MTDVPETQRSRRQPVYILADRSGSMEGDAIVAVNQGLKFLKSDLEDEPRCVETVWLAIISFGEGGAREDVPLTELEMFEPPTLIASGSTPLGEALSLLDRAIDRDVSRSSGAHTGDYRPLVFVFTDGQPTDEWQQPAQKLRGRTAVKAADIIAVGCGSDADLTMLQALSPNVMYMEQVTAGNFRSLVQWLSQSIKVASRSRASADRPGAGDGAFETPPPPPGFKILGD